MKREWNIAEQARIAKANFDARPEWVKRISYFAGTNNVENVEYRGHSQGLKNENSSIHILDRYNCLGKL